MMMALGQFVFGMDTLAFQDLDRQAAWRHAANSRVGDRPARQYIGPGDETITLSGTLAPEFRGSSQSLVQLRAMADDGNAYALVDGAGGVYGAFVIEGVTEKGSVFIAEGLPRKTTFTIQLKSTDDATQVDPGGGADDTGGSGWDFEPWDWWLGEE